MDGIKIKPLVWVDFPERGAKAQAWNEANYMIQRWSDGRWELSASYPGYGDSIYGIDRFYSTLEAAKAAAQADYAARILAALEPAALAPTDAAQAREAALQMAVTVVRQALVDAAFNYKHDKALSSAMFKAEIHATNAILALLSEART